MKRKRILGLSWQLAKREFKLRNEDSYLGNLWYILNPLLLFLLLFLIFFDRIGQTIPSYPAYLLIGLIILNFFSRITIESTSTIINSGFIKSINFPREMLVISVILKHLLAHAFEIIVFFIVLFFLGIPIYGILFYLLILIFLSLFIYGVSLFLSSLTIYFVDLREIWIFLTTLLLFLTPIFYEIGGQKKLFILNLFNPLFYFITATREIIIYSRLPEMWIISGILTYTLLSLIVGIVVFNKLKNKFAELI